MQPTLFGLFVAGIYMILEVLMVITQIHSKVEQIEKKKIFFRYFLEQKTNYTQSLLSC